MSDETPKPVDAAETVKNTVEEPVATTTVEESSPAAAAQEEEKSQLAVEAVASEETTAAESKEATNAEEEKEKPEPAASSSDSEDAKPESEQQPEQDGEKPESEQVEEETPPEPIVIPEGQGQLVLVTGASGFLASHIVKALLESGQFKVRGSVRSLENESKCNPLKNLVESPIHELELVEADLTNAESWTKAVEGCDFVIHTAASFPTSEPNDENELITPAKDGTIAILKACVESKTVKRVVLTSSVKSVSGGLPADKASMDEEVWADTEKPLGAYAKSKVAAEKAAWDFIKELPEDQTLELAVVNPGFIMGPPLMAASAESTSITVVKKLMNREYPTLPKLSYPLIDVRDCALAHIRAMMIKQAAGKRFIVAGANASLQDVAKVLSAEFDQQGFNVPTSQAPYVLVWLKSRFDKDLKRILPDVGKVYNYDTKRMKEILQVEPRDYNVTLTEMGHALIDLGIVKKVEKNEKKKTIRKKKVKEEGEEKKDEPEKIEDMSGGEGSATSEAKVDDIDVVIDEPTNEVKPATEEEEEVKDDEIKVEAPVAAAEEHSSDEVKEGASSSEETSPKKKDKKEKKDKKDRKEKEKKKPLFSFSFKKKQKPAVEKKEETDKEAELAGGEVTVTDAAAESAVTEETAPATESAATEETAPTAVTEETAPTAVTEETAPAAVTEETAPTTVTEETVPAEAAATEDTTPAAEAAEDPVPEAAEETTETATEDKPTEATEDAAKPEETTTESAPAEDTPEAAAPTKSADKTEATEESPAAQS